MESKRLEDCLCSFLDVTNTDLSPARSKDEFPFINLYGEADAEKLLQAGDHLAIPMQYGAYHHLIWMGNSFVVDNNPSAQCSPITKRPWSELLKHYYSPQSVVYRLHYEDNASGNRRQTAIAIATHFAKASSDLQYTLHGFNCEAFATFCWTRKWCEPSDIVALQVDRAPSRSTAHPKSCASRQMSEQVVKVADSALACAAGALSTSLARKSG